MAKKPAKTPPALRLSSPPQLLARKSNDSIAITPVAAAGFDAWLKAQDTRTKQWVAASHFTGAAGAMLSIPDDKGRVARVLFGTGSDDSLYTYADLPARLPANKSGYYIDAKIDSARADQIALGWLLGSYHFSAYKSSGAKTFASLVWPEAADKKSVQATAEAVWMVRDLVNIPPNDLGPAEIALAGKKVADRFNKASVKVIVGEDLLKKNYPTIYTVGKASPREPRLIDIRWPNKGKPKVTLVGKGVAFDTGGLDIKPSSAMAQMKKDMGGAAHVLGLAHMIMSANLPIDLRVLIPAVENSVDGKSFRTSDVIKTRKGITVEVGNTDAEGRLILCDALAEACNDKPDLIIDFATLTGAARVALGPDLPAMFSNDDKVANDLLESGMRVQDPLWRLPLWPGYKDALSSKIADTSSTGGQAGAITAALFLEKFITPKTPWVHIDTFSWNNGNRPGRPDGGDALGMRASFDMIKRRYATPPAKKAKATTVKGPRK